MWITLVAELMFIENKGRNLDKAGDYEVIDAARRHMALRSDVPLTVDQIASSLGVSVRRLTVAFERGVGVSAAAYVRAERMRIAQRLLLQTSQSIQAVAAELGFSNSANFSSAFRDFTGMTPSEFRKVAPLDKMLATSSDIKWGQGPV